MRSRRGIVRLAGVRAGVLEETEGGSRFRYDARYLARKGALAISRTLPLRVEPYVGRGLLPFFENLLPEGWLLKSGNLPLPARRNEFLRCRAYGRLSFGHEKLTEREFVSEGHAA